MQEARLSLRPASSCLCDICGDVASPHGQGQLCKMHWEALCRLFAAVRRLGNPKETEEAKA